MSLEFFTQTMFTIFGLLVGSFLNAVIYRLPRGINIAVPRSHCTSCKKMIYWYENIPIISYIFLRGKCSKCGQSYSLRYLLVEVVVGVVAFLLAPANFEPSNLMTFFFAFSIFCCFLCHFLIDIEHQILPDSITVYLALIFLSSSMLSHSWQYIILGAGIGFGFTYGITFLFYKLKGQVGLGGGDIKLFAVLGITLGPIGIINNIFLSCFFGAIFSLVLMSLGKMNRQSKLAFGPFIIIVAAFQIFFPAYFRSFSSLWSI